MNKLAKITGVALLSVGLLAGCQSKEEKLLQGKWEHSLGHETRTFKEDTVSSKFSDGSGSERKFEAKKGKKDNQIIIIEKFDKKSGDHRTFDSEETYKLSEDKNTLWQESGDYFYERVED